MRDGFEFDGPAESGTVGQVLADAAVIGLEKLLQDQDREELMLGELLGTEPMAVGRQRIGGNGVGGHQHAFGRLAGRAHVPLSNTQPTTAQY